MNAKDLLKKQLRKIIRESINEMSGFSRVKNMMMGSVDSVDTIGIITAENPMGQSAPKQANLNAQTKLKQNIRSLNLGFIQIKGVYGNTENPFVIPNISKKDLISLGKTYNQESIIFGERESDESKTYFKWDYIECNPEKIVKSVYKNISNDRDVENREDFYSAVKGRRFYFPFFDEIESDTIPSKEYSTSKQSMKSPSVQVKS